MVHHRYCALGLLLGLAALAGVASAQGAGSPPAPKPAKPAASAVAGVPLTYRSAFDNYQAYSEEAPAPWRETNARVRQAGGWRAYAREASPAADNAAKAPQTPASGADPHAGHHTKP